jgi:hypothetical protein
LRQFWKKLPWNRGKNIRAALIYSKANKSVLLEPVPKLGWLWNRLAVMWFFHRFEKARFPPEFPRENEKNNKAAREPQAIATSYFALPWGIGYSGNFDGSEKE